MERAGTPYKKKPLSEDEALNLVCDARGDEPAYPFFMRPVMVVIAGPPGSGKSTAFPVRESGVDYFNADDVAATLNQSYQKVPPHIRAEANRRFEAFVLDHIADRFKL